MKSPYLRLIIHFFAKTISKISLAVLRQSQHAARAINSNLDSNCNPIPLIQFSVRTELRKPFN